MPEHTESYNASTFEFQSMENSLLGMTTVKENIQPALFLDKSVKKNVVSRRYLRNDKKKFKEMEGFLRIIPGGVLLDEPCGLFVSLLTLLTSGQIQFLSNTRDHLLSTYVRIKRGGGQPDSLHLRTRGRDGYLIKSVRKYYFSFRVYNQSVPVFIIGLQYGF